MVRVLLPSTPIPHSLCPFFDRTIGTAEEGPVYLYSMTNNAAATVTTGRSQGSNCTFKAVEDMRVTSHDHLKGLIVIITTQFTPSHTHSSLYRTILVTRCRMCPDSLVVKRESPTSTPKSRSAGDAVPCRSARCPRMLLLPLIHQGCRGRSPLPEREVSSHALSSSKRAA